MVLVTFNIGDSGQHITVDYGVYINRIQPLIVKAKEDKKNKEEIRKEIMRIKYEEARI